MTPATTTMETIMLDDATDDTIPTPDAPDAYAQIIADVALLAHTAKDPGERKGAELVLSGFALLEGRLGSLARKNLRGLAALKGYGANEWPTTID